MDNNLAVDVSDSGMDFQIGNFLNAINQIVAYFAFSGDIVVMSDEAIIDALKYYVKHLENETLR